ncbi:hypothetical protein PoB_005979300 [Plakobranchus ocellatus]|uniref:Uncharacterized protein n=1 Tax=Plakobranchus ocellatus TaxID=259542 RepID=A0AAV4CMR7_9GAST|nr:hypothetical protein PoB_005979300 [Plakobranchus ocellatus]
MESKEEEEEQEEEEEEEMESEKGKEKRKENPLDPALEQILRHKGNVPESGLTYQPLGMSVKQVHQTISDRFGKRGHDGPRWATAGCNGLLEEFRIAKDPSGILSYHRYQRGDNMRL